MAVEDSLVCSACRYQVPRNIASCPNCGTWLGLIESEHGSEDSEPDETSAIPEVPYPDTTESGAGQKLKRQDTAIGKLIYADDETLCSHCGSVHSLEAQFCPKTGKLIRDDDASKLCDTITADRHFHTQFDLHHRKKTLWFIGIVIVLLLFVSIAIAGGRYSKQIGVLQVDPSPSHTSVVLNIQVSEQTSTSTISSFPVTYLSPSATLTTTALSSKTLVPSKSPTPSPNPTLGIGSTIISSHDGMELVYVPGGEFLIGLNDSDVAEFLKICPSCDTWSLRDQRPQKEIYLDSYWIDRTEVTIAQFAEFVAATGYTTTAEQKGMSYVMIRGNADFIYIDDADWRHPSGSGSEIVDKGDYPVTQISWDDAVAYCDWVGRRLPTEAEWEKAARGVAGWLYPWGNTGPNDDLLNYNFSNAGPIQVGSFPGGASPYSVYDMAGNVWEWVADFYSEYFYQTMPDRNPEGPDSGDGHPLRGGSWASERGPFMMYTLSTFRLWNYPYIRSNVIGFRCASSN